MAASVDPSGRGDYTTLAAWNTAADGDNAIDNEASCTGDVGGLLMSAWTRTDNKNAVIFADENNTHDGTDNATGLASILSPLAGTIHLTISSNDDVTIRGMRIESSLTSNVIVSALNCNNLLMEKCFIKLHSVSSGVVANAICLQDSHTSAGTKNNTYRNNIFFLTNLGAATVQGGSNHAAILFITNANAAINYTCNFYNNTIRILDPDLKINNGLDVHREADASSTHNFTFNCKNNVILGDYNSDAFLKGVDSGSGSFTFNARNNASNDNSARVYYDSRNDKINLDTRKQFVDHEKNFHLSTNSECINTGVAISGFADDAVSGARPGITIPNTTEWDIGALEYIGDLKKLSIKDFLNNESNLKYLTPVRPLATIGGIEQSGSIVKVNARKFDDRRKIINISSGTQIALTSPYSDTEIRYTLNGDLPNRNSAVYSTPFVFRDNRANDHITLRARIYAADDPDNAIFSSWKVNAELGEWWFRVV